MARKRRRAFWTAFAVACALVIGGAVVAYLGYEETAGPDGAVKGYFAALRRGDAPGALAFGDVPPGPHTLLTSTVLREQQRLAPMSNVQVTAVQRRGNTANVDVHYDLAFPTDRLSVHDTISVVRRGHSWHLARAAATTRLDLLQARNRATIVGAAVPDSTVLVFPGAAPIRLDTPFLSVEPSSSVINLSAGDDTAIGVDVSDAGRAAARSALAVALRSCASAGSRADPRCPLPSSTRAVPGTVRATVPARATDSVGVVVLADPDGVVQLVGTIQVSGRYNVLDFNNVASVHRGSFAIQVQALAFAREPVVIQWQQVGT